MDWLSKDRCKFIAMFMVLLLCICNIQAGTKHHTAQHHAQTLLVDAGAKYADYVMDINTGKILHATDSNSPRHPASLTKMMTLYLTFKALADGRLQLDQQLPVSDYAAAQSPTKLGLRSGATISVKDAILSLVTESANDSAVVLAEALGGSEFVFSLEMNMQAKALGMDRTYFYNASGLPNPNQVSTARDMATLGLDLIRQYPNYYTFFKQDEFVYNGRHYHTHNHLMDKYPGMDGIKTGYIRMSGFNLVASAKHGDTRLLGVVFGGSSPDNRNQRMAQLLDAGFSAAQHADKPAVAKSIPAPTISADKVTNQKAG